MEEGNVEQRDQSPKETRRYLQILNKNNAFLGIFGLIPALKHTHKIL